MALQMPGIILAVPISMCLLWIAAKRFHQPGFILCLPVCPTKRSNMMGN